jgi:hypothetical protein
MAKFIRNFLSCGKKIAAAALWGSLFLALSQTPALAKAPASQNTPSRIVPLQSQSPFWDGLSFGMTVFSEKPHAFMKLLYDTQSGLGITMEQVLRGVFVGGVHVRATSWRTKDATPGNRLMPISIIARAEVQPPLDFLLGEAGGKLIRPFLYAGPGYLMFTSLSDIKTPQNRSTGSLGAGIKFVFDDRLAFRFAAESTASLSSKDIQTGVFLFEVQFGDLARP